MASKEYAGDDLEEIREFFMRDNEVRYTEVYADKGAEGFTLSTDSDEYESGYTCYVVVWPRSEGGYWSEEY